jgi:hypothetical protein
MIANYVVQVLVFNDSQKIFHVETVNASIFIYPWRSLMRFSYWNTCNFYSGMPAILWEGGNSINEDNSDDEYLKYFQFFIVGLTKWESINWLNGLFKIILFWQWTRILYPLFIFFNLISFKFYRRIFPNFNWNYLFG